MKNSNKPAFPQEYKSFENPDKQMINAYSGLTKREYIAIEAMIGLLSNPENAIDGKAIAEFAIKQADELLKQLGE